MEEFDLENMGGTSISDLKKREVNSEPVELYVSESDKLPKFSYDIDNKIKPKKTKKKSINMNNFVRDLETNLENLSKKPTQYDIVNTNNNISSINLKGNINNEKSGGSRTFYEQCIEFKYLDIIFSILLFLLLNNKLSIEIIYKIPYINSIDSPYPNLLIRSIIFGLLIFLIKKYYL